MKKGIIGKIKQDETLLGIDFGETNTGLAFGRNGIVSPIKTINGKDRTAAINEIARFITQNSVKRVVVGIPLTASGKETQQSLEIRKFAKLLKIFTKRPIEFQNEYGTTQDTVEEMLENGISQKRRRVQDHFSAALILKRYIDEKS